MREADMPNERSGLDPASSTTGQRHVPGGYHGNYLSIELNATEPTPVTARHVSFDPTVLRRFLGGSGLGTWLMLEHGAATCDPLSPAAAIAFVFSPLVGSPLTTSAKFAVVSKSPLTDRINDSLASSGFAIAGKQAGCDALLVTGRAASPSILVIDQDEVRLEPADAMWGATCSETERQLTARFSSGWQFAVIGPAGERLVRYATISHDGRHAGRGGSGAVLGAKNIKAIAVRGTTRCEWAAPTELMRLAKTMSKKSMGPATEKYRELGTASNLLLFNRLNTLPTRNFQQGQFEGATALSPESMSVARTRTRAYCAACTIGCEHLYSLSDQGGASVRLEYENLFALGPLCGVGDPDVVLSASQRCDELGIDTISAGGTIAFAMECVERGQLDQPWLRFGDGSALLKAIDLIGTGEGFGGELAQGSRRLAKSIGGDTIQFAAQVKGLELPGYEPRSLQTMALGLAVGTRGADHNRSGAYEIDFSDRADRHNLVPATASLAIETEDKAALIDSLILCKFLRGIFADFYSEASEMLNLVTGWETNAAELQTISRRIITAKKLFNILAGWTPDEDTLPDRFLKQPLPDDSAARMDAQQLSAAIQMYNEQRGWSPEGWIDAKQLEDLGLACFGPGKKVRSQ
jgi:aldehyde:ferredoxin oxidoreductase